MAVPLKIFIAGGAGFIGRHLVKALLARGHEVYGLAKDRTRGKVLEELGCRPIIGNLLTNGPWERAIEKFDVAIGCTMPGRRGQPPTMKQVPELLKSHTDACSNLILAVHEGMLKGLILTLGVLSYGDHGEAWVDEDTPREPIGYGRFSGPAVHTLAHLAESKRVKATFMFPGWAYGNGSWFKDMLLTAFEQGKARVVGSGENYMWLSVVARALAKPIPPSISVEASVQQAGELWTESVTCSLRVKNERAKSMLGWTLKYPTVHAGVPVAVDAIRKER